MRKEEQVAAAARAAPPHGRGLEGDRRRLRRQQRSGRRHAGARFRQAVLAHRESRAGAGRARRALESSLADDQDRDLRAREHVLRLAAEDQAAERAAAVRAEHDGVAVARAKRRMPFQGRGRARCRSARHFRRARFALHQGERLARRLLVVLAPVARGSGRHRGACSRRRRRTDAAASRSTPLTRAPSARARLTPVSTPRAESGEPSVGIRMCRNMRSARHQHRQLRMREHALRLAAEDQAAEAAASVRGHDDGIAVRRIARCAGCRPRAPDRW